MVDYIKDFIPKSAQYTNSLSKLLKKNSSPWSEEQTIAVSSSPCPKSPSLGDSQNRPERILETDARDHYQGAIMIEQEGEKNYYCGHASGQFKEAEKHYHTTFKEALMVKKWNQEI